MTSAIWQSGARVHRSSALWLPCSILVFLTAVAAFFRWHMPGLPQDDGILLVAPERFLRGDLPNRDFLSVYGPGNIWLLAAFYKVFGVSLMTTRCVGALYQSAIVCGVFLVARRVGRFSGLVCALTTLLLLIPLGSAPYAWIGALGLATWSLVFALGAAENVESPKGVQRFGLLAAGVLAALAVTWRLDLSPALLLFFVLSWRALSPGQKKQLVFGVGAGLLPLLAHIALVSPQLFFDNCLLDPIFRSGPARRLPFSSLMFENQVSLVLTSLSALAIVVFAVLSSRNNASHGALCGASIRAQQAMQTALGCFCLGLLPQAWQRADSIHLHYVACLVIALLPYAVTAWWQSRVRKRAADAFSENTSINSLRAPYEGRFLGLPVSDSLRRRIERSMHEQRPRWMAPVVLFVLLLLSPQLFADGYFPLQNALPGASKLPMSYEVRNNRRVFLLESATSASDTQATIDFVQNHVASGRRLFVGERDLSRARYNDTFLYYLLPNLQPASYYTELNPHSANRPGSSLAPDIATADVLVLTTAYAKCKEPNASLIPGSTAADQTVHALFRRIYARGSYTVWVKKRGVNSIYSA